MPRLVLQDSVRTSDVDAHFARLGFAAVELVPRVFPGRAEPARTSWETDDEATRATLWVEVAPPRRVLSVEGADAEAVADTVCRTLGVTTRAQLLEALSGSSDEAAFAAVYKLADGFGAAAVPPIVACLSGYPSDYLASGCVRALERVGRAALEALDDARGDARHAPATRALASAAASALRYT